MEGANGQKIKLRNASKDDKLSVSSYEDAIIELEAFRRKFPHGVYIFKIRNHRIVSAEGNPRLFGKI